MEALSGYKNTVIEKGVVLLPLLLFAASRPFEEELVRLVMSFFAPEPDKGYVFYQDFVRLCFSELVWFGLFAVLVIIFRNQDTFTALNERIRSWRATPFLISSLIVFSGLTLTIVHAVLDDFPNSSDEYAYIFQAETLSKGQLWQEVPAFSDCFHFNHIVQKDGVRAGRFPPGWPMLLTSAFFLNIPTWIINPILGGLCMLVLYGFARRFYNKKIALWSVVTMTATSFFLFNAASYFSHVSCMLACLLFVYSMSVYFEEETHSSLLLAGFFLGWVILIRYFTAVLLFLPFFIFMIQKYRTRIYSPMMWLGLGALPAVLFLGWYNFEITGNPLVPVTVWGDEREGLGFVRNHTFMSGVEHVIRWLFMFTYWCSPGLLILYFLFLWKKVRGSALLERPEDYFFVVLIAGYFFYYQIGGNQYGPRFMFEALPFLTILVVRNVVDSRPALVRVVLVVSVLYAIVRLPFISLREQKIVTQRQDVYHEVARRNIHHAIVVVQSHVSPIRPMPVGDLTRNSSTFDDDVLYVHDCEELRTGLLSRYPDRRVYRYVRDVDEARGELIRIR